MTNNSDGNYWRFSETASYDISVRPPPPDKIIEETFGKYKCETSLTNALLKYRHLGHLEKEGENE